MMARVDLSIIVAVEYAQQNISAIVEEINLDLHSNVELIICYTDVDKGVPTLLSRHDNIHLIHSENGSRIPHMWRDGIYAAVGDQVAVTTAHCVPSADWVDQLLSLKQSTEVAGVGGVIINDSAASARDWAIYFIRYINYAPPKKAIVADDIAADNALYQRTDIMKHTELLKLGFWEPSFHAEFRHDGKCLKIEPELRVFHQNTYTTRQFFNQRFEHAKEFGLARASSKSLLLKLVLLFLSPILPFVFLSKILRAIRINGHYTKRIIPASPWLMLFLIAWGSGEALGYFNALKTKN
ncbi:glycosyltransferase [Cycloclasticus zancles]|jgi:hypothetical protein|nr:glycosyltransferase [Cycloclasticus zancles]